MATFQSGSTTIGDVRSYGAIGDGVADDTVAIQAAIDAVGVAYLPAGTYCVSFPVRWRFKSLIYGDGRHVSILKNTVRGQPTVLHCAPRQFDPLYDDPTGGDPFADPYGDADGWVLDGSIYRWLNLSDAHTLSAPTLDGSTTFDLRFDFRPASASTAGQPRSITASGGSEDDTGPGWTSCFLALQIDDAIRFQWKSGGSVRILDCPASLTAGIWHACRLQLVAGTMTATVTPADGSPVTASASAVGAMDQSWHETVTIGTVILRWPEGAAIFGATTGRVKDFSLAGAPGGPFTMALTDGDRALFPYDATAGGTGRLFARMNGYVDLYGLCELRDVAIDAGYGIGVMSTSGPHTYIHDVLVYNDTRGIWLWNNSYFSTISNVMLEWANVVRITGVGLQTACAVSQVTNCEVQYATCHFLMSDADSTLGGLKYSGGYCRRGLLMKGDQCFVNLDGLTGGDEAISPPENVGGLAIFNARGLVCGLQIWNSLTPHPPVTLGNSTILFVAPVFVVSDGTASEMIHVEDAPAGAASQVLGPSIRKSSAPLSLSADIEVLTGGGPIGGFSYLATCAGPPTGTPTTKAGMAAMIYDSTNDDCYIYRGGWKKSHFA